jgi:ABC-2 type transport system permease protein
MRPSIVWAIARNEALILSRDPWLKVYVLLMPLVFGWITVRTATLALDASGSAPAAGPQHVVAGLAVTFAFMLVGDIAAMVLRDHLNNVWDDLRATPANRRELLAGKVGLSLIGSVLYLVGTFYLAAGAFDVRIEGSPVGVVLVAVGLAVVLVMLGVLLFSLSSTGGQMMAMVNLSVAVFGGLGGTVIPRGLLPDLVARLSPLTPGYWAMTGLQGVIRGDSLLSLLPTLAAFLGFALALGAAAGVGLLREQRKII